MIKTRTAFKKWIDSEKFYILAQNYRSAPIEDQKKVMKAFKALKDGIMKEIKGPR